MKQHYKFAFSQISLIGVYSSVTSMWLYRYDLLIVLMSGLLAHGITGKIRLMKRTITTLLISMVIFSLTFGQALFSSAMAKSMGDYHQAMQMQSTNSTLSDCMSKSHCPDHQNKSSKADMCRIACATFSQIVIPTTPITETHSPAKISFVVPDKSAVSYVIYPDLPPPRT